MDMKESRLLNLRRLRSSRGQLWKALSLSGPISRDIAIVLLQYPLWRDTFAATPAIPPQGAIPPLGAFFYTDISLPYPILQRIARCLCDTPGKQARNRLAILSLKVSRDMKSIATGPLSPLRNHFWKKKRPQPYWGGAIILEMLWKSQMPLTIGFRGSQPYSRREFQDESVSRVFPEFFRNFFRKAPAVLGVWLTYPLATDNTCGWIIHCIADTDADENCFGIYFCCRCRHSCYLQFIEGAVHSR